MKGSVYIDTDKVGEVDFQVIDASMGVIGGYLFPSDNYSFYKPQIQAQCDTKGNSNIADFNYRIILEDNIELEPAGGISIIDIAKIHEIYVESAGLDFEKFQISE